MYILTWHNQGLFQPGTAESEGDKEVDRLCDSTPLGLANSKLVPATPTTFRPIKGVWDMSNVKSMVLPETRVKPQELIDAN